MKTQPSCFAAVLLCLLPLVAPATPRVVATKSPPRPTPKKSSPSTNTDLRQADALFDEGSYARALTIYQAALKSADAAQREHGEWRVAQALQRLGKWQQAVAAGEQLLGRTTQRARVSAWLGRLYVRHPDSQRLFSEKYLAKAIACLERARAQTLSDARTVAPKRLSDAERAGVNFDLVRLLGGHSFWRLGQQWRKTPPRVDETIDLKQPYDAGWIAPKKALYLLAEVPRLDTTPNRHWSALALLATGSYLQNYRGGLIGYGEGSRYEPPAFVEMAAAYFTDEDAPQPTLTPTPVPTPRAAPAEWPFVGRDPLAPWRELTSKYPTHPLAADALFLLARDRLAKGETDAALDMLRDLAKRHPKSKWAAEAKGVVARVTRRELFLSREVAERDFYSVQPPRRTATPPGEAPRFVLWTRNVERVRLRVFRVRLENVLPKSRAHSGWNYMADHYGPLHALEKRFGAPVAEWTQAVTPRGPDESRPYAAVKTAFALPIREAGAYLVEALDEGGKTRSVQMALLSNIALLRKDDGNSKLLIAVDARNGQPLPGVALVLREWTMDWIEDDAGNTKEKWSERHTRGTTDSEGVHAIKLGGSEEFETMEVLARRGDDYALLASREHTERPGSDYQGYDPKVRAYIVTDRTLYRPGQTVNYRQIFTEKIDGKHTPLKNRRLRVGVWGPSGRKLFQTQMVTSEFGSVHGSFTLPANAPLGEYYVRGSRAEKPTDEFDEGSHSFRVEEYKRPEFTVTVEAPAKAARAGEIVRARVRVLYGWGAPVEGAKVGFAVRRSTWTSEHHFPTDFDWLRGDRQPDNFHFYSNAEKPLHEGTTVTNSQGEAEISFTAPPGEVPPECAWLQPRLPLFIVSAEVSDAGRRTVTASGVVRAAPQEFFAFARSQRAYFAPGQSARIEIVTRDANDKPCAARGNMAVYQLRGDGTESKIATTPLAIDGSGTAAWEWKVPEGATGGALRAAFEATDAHGIPVRAWAPFWVVAPRMDVAFLRRAGLALVPRDEIQLPGGSAHVLLVSARPNATVLLTEEANGKILRRRWITFEGHAQEITLALGREHSPNFALAAAGVHDFRVRRAEANIFVPPPSSLLNVSVRGDKDVYKPGEKGVFTIETTDTQGRPARAEVSLSISDASLLQIWGGRAAAMRLFYHGFHQRQLQVGLASSAETSLAFAGDEREMEPGFITKWTLPATPGVGKLVYNDTIQDPAGFTDFLVIPFSLWNQWRVTTDYEREGYGGRGVAKKPVAQDGPPLLQHIFDLAQYRQLGKGTPCAETARKLGIYYRVQEAFIAASSPMKAREFMFGCSSSMAPPGMAVDRPQARRDFRETALWAPSVITENGRATVTMTFPDSATEWRVAAQGVTAGGAGGVEAGDSHGTVRTSQNLLVRLQVPRFFILGDRTVISANVHNYSGAAQRLSVSLEAGAPLKLVPGAAQLAAGQSWDVPQGEITVAVGGQARINWLVEATGVGEAKLQVAARGDESDAVEMRFPVLEHGAPRFLAQNGIFDGAHTSGAATFTLPPASQRGAARLELRVAPGAAGAMLDALPYLEKYPYDCAEQTVSRFVPALLAERALLSAKVNLPALRERAAQSSTARARNVLFDQPRLRKLTEEGLQRLKSTQRADGGWGWWPASRDADPLMTAYVVRGLLAVRGSSMSFFFNGVYLRAFNFDDMLGRACAYLGRELRTTETQRDPDLQACLLLPLAQRGKLDAGARAVAEKLFASRTRLAPQGQALLALALWHANQKERAAQLMRNIENTVKTDPKSGAARWTGGGDWWNWRRNDVETTALALRAYLLIAPRDHMVAPLRTWLLGEMEGGHWPGSKATAEAVTTLALLAGVDGELGGDAAVTARLGGSRPQELRLPQGALLLGDNTLEWNEKSLRDGANQLTLQWRGRGRFAWSAALEHHSREEPVRAASNRIAVSRRYFRVERKDGKETRHELAAGAAFRSGDEIEAELRIQADNDFAHVAVEDHKPAGLEPVRLLSGYAWGDGLCSNVELRDDKTAFFVDELPQGTSLVRYRLRAASPGHFHALPAQAWAMYASRARANSDEANVAVRDEQP